MFNVVNMLIVGVGDWLRLIKNINFIIDYFVIWFIVCGRVRVKMIDLRV